MPAVFHRSVGELSPQIMERISRQGDENLYQPKLHSTRIRQLHLMAVNEQKPMTRILDTLVERGVREYNNNMAETLETQMEKLSGSVSYFTLQRVDSMASDPDNAGWFLSFVDSEARELEGSNLKELIQKASNLVFPVSSEDQPAAPESSALPVPRNR
jgi:hypothetical protein